MSIQHAAARALAAVQRAQSLHGVSAEAPTPGGPSLGTAAQAVADAGRRASVLSGDLIDAHQGFVAGATRILTGNDHTDTALYQLLDRAAALTQRGRSQLDAIVDRTRSLAAAAVTTRTPAGQRALLQALRSEVSNADAVVNSTQQQASDIAGQIRSLDYHGAREAGSHDDFNLDTQYARPQGLPGGAPADGDTPAWTALTLTVVQVTQTKTWWTQPWSKGEHCK